MGVELLFFDICRLFKRSPENGLQSVPDARPNGADSPQIPTERDQSADMEPIMRISRKGIGEIISNEAIILNSYIDSVGKWTIGAGVTDAAGASIKPSQFDGEITVGQAYEMLLDLLPRYERYVQKLLDNAGVHAVRQHEYDALVSLAWNVGNILSIKSQTVTTRQYLAEGDIAGAINLWRANETTSPGLKKRRDNEVFLARSGKYLAKTAIVANARDGRVIWSRSRDVPLAEIMRCAE